MRWCRVLGGFRVCGERVCLCLPALFKGALRRGRHTLCMMMGAKHAHAKRARGVWGDKFPPRRPRVSGARVSALYLRA